MLAPVDTALRTRKLSAMYTFHTPPLNEKSMPRGRVNFAFVPSALSANAAAAPQLPATAVATPVPMLMWRIQRLPVSARNMSVLEQAMPCGEENFAAPGAPSAFPPTAPVPANVEVSTGAPATYALDASLEKDSLRTQWLPVSATKIIAFATPHIADGELNCAMSWEPSTNPEADVFPVNTLE